MSSSKAVKNIRLVRALASLCTFRKLRPKIDRPFAHIENIKSIMYGELINDFCARVERLKQTAFKNVNLTEYSDEYLKTSNRFRAITQAILFMFYFLHKLYWCCWYFRVASERDQSVLKLIIFI